MWTKHEFFTANTYMAHTLYIQSTEWNICRLPLVSKGVLKSPHCVTLLIHSIWLDRQRTQLWTPCHICGSWQRVLPEMGCPILSKFNTGSIFLKSVKKILWSLKSCILFNLLWSTIEPVGAPVIWSQQAGTILPIIFWLAIMVGK